MGASKSDQFNFKQNQMAIIAKALGHPARIAILEYLAGAEGCICGDIVNELPLSQPTISQHLREMKNANLIHGNVEGNAICYCLNNNTLTQIQEYIQSITAKSKCC